MSQAAISEGPASANAEDVFLVGQVGKEYIQNTLSTNSAPLVAIKDIQDRGSLHDPQCQPLLGFLDQLGISRAESHKYIVDKATSELIERIPTLSPELLLRLLEESFPYIGITELRAVPLAVLQHLRPVPNTFLKQLASDRELFWELPPQVQRQAWGMDKHILQMHAALLIAAYTHETASAVQGLNMDTFMRSFATHGHAVPAFHGKFGDSDNTDTEAAAGVAHQAPIVAEHPTTINGREGTKSQRQLPTLARKNLRKGSAALCKLVSMVGNSRIIYKGIVDAVLANYRNIESQVVGMREAALCMLRSQLIMALHDAGETALCSSDPCYKLAWTLDACLKERECSAHRVGEIQNFLSMYSDMNERMKTLKRKRGGSAGQNRPGSGIVRDDDAESAGVPGAVAAEDPLRHLGDAGMLLRDPAPFYLILHQVIRGIERCVAAHSVPKEDAELVFLTRLLTLAIFSVDKIQSGVFEYLSEEDTVAMNEILQYLYPLLAEVLLDQELRKGQEHVDDDAFSLQPPQELSRIMVRNEMGRHIVQMYALERLHAGDLVTGRIVLLSVASCLEFVQSKVLPQFAPFGFTLARRLATLLSSKQITTEHPLWEVAVDRVLLHLVDAETRVHEEVLRLLLSAGDGISTERLAGYLESALKYSERSRAAQRKRAVDAHWLQSLLAMGLHVSFADNDMHDMDIDVDEVGSSAVDGSGWCMDGVRSTYQLFIKSKRSTKLNRRVAPALFKYLDSAAAP